MNIIDAAKAAIAAGQGPQRYIRGKPIENGIPAEILEAMAAGLSDRQIVERYVASGTTVQSHWRPALQAWLAMEWPALAVWQNAADSNGAVPRVG